MMTLKNSTARDPLCNRSLGSWLVTGVISAAMLLTHSAAPTLPAAGAQEIQITGPLAGAPAVHKQRLWRKGRLQLQPFFGFTLQNEYARTLLVGAQVKYHFTDWLGLGLWGAGGVAQLKTKLTKEVKRKGVTTSNNRLSLPDKAAFDKQIGKLQWMAGVDVSIIPLRGKISLFQKIFLDTDLQLFAGPAFVGIEERSSVNGTLCDASSADFGDGSACLASQRARSKRVAIAPSFGVGINAYFREFMGISIQWRGIPFRWNTSGTDESGGDGGTFPDGLINKKDRLRHFNHMFTFGFVIYLPTGIKTTK